MVGSSNRLIALSLLILEIVSIYALISVLGMMIGNEGSPIGWVQMTLVIAAAYTASASVNGYRIPTGWARYSTAFLGMMAIYLLIGNHVETGPVGIDFLWARYFAADQRPEGFSQVVVIGGFVGAALWYRGAEIASAEEIIDKLQSSFKMGLLILGPSVVIDLITPSDLHIIQLLAIFFFASLAAFCISNVSLSSSSRSRQRSWLYTFGVVVGGLLAAGLIMAVFERFVLSWLANPTLKVIGFATSVVFYIVVWPLAYLFGFVVQGIIKLFTLLGGETDFDVESLGEFGQQVEQRRDVEAASSPGYLAYFEWVLLGCILLGLVVFLYGVFRRRIGVQHKKTYEFREPLPRQRFPLSDMVELLRSLLPEQLKNKNTKIIYRIPHGDPLVAEIFRIYYKILAVAEEKGFVRQVWETPNEYKSKLGKIFPSDIAEKATKAFNKACYGNRPSSRKVVQDMESYLSNISSEEQN